MSKFPTDNSHNIQNLPGRQAFSNTSNKTLTPNITNNALLDAYSCAQHDIYHPLHPLHFINCSGFEVDKGRIKDISKEPVDRGVPHFDRIECPIKVHIPTWTPAQRNVFAYWSLRTYALERWQRYCYSHNKNNPTRRMIFWKRCECGCAHLCNNKGSFLVTVLPECWPENMKSTVPQTAELGEREMLKKFAEHPRFRHWLRQNFRKPESQSKFISIHKTSRVRFLQQYKNFVGTSCDDRRLEKLAAPLLLTQPQCEGNCCLFVPSPKSLEQQQNFTSYGNSFSYEPAPPGMNYMNPFILAGFQIKDGLFSLASGTAGLVHTVASFSLGQVCNAFSLLGTKVCERFQYDTTKIISMAQDLKDKFAALLKNLSDILSALPFLRHLSGMFDQFYEVVVTCGQKYGLAMMDLLYSLVESVTRAWSLYLANPGTNFSRLLISTFFFNVAAFFSKTIVIDVIEEIKTQRQSIPQDKNIARSFADFIVNVVTGKEMIPADRSALALKFNILNNAKNIGIPLIAGIGAGLSWLMYELGIFHDHDGPIKDCLADLLETKTELQMLLLRSTAMSVHIERKIAEIESIIGLVQAESTNKKVSDALRKQAFTDIRDAVRMISEFRSKIKVCDTAKIKTVVIAVSGSPGKGKSTMLYKLAPLVYKHLAHPLRLEYDENVNIYSRPRTSEYWDGYTENSWITLMDDIFAVQKSDIKSEEYATILDLTTDVKYPLNMSVAGEKGNYFFNSDILYLTSNLDLRNSLTVNSVPEALDPSAFKRRVTFFVEIVQSVNQCYSLSVTTVNERPNDIKSQEQTRLMNLEEFAMVVARQIVEYRNRATTKSDNPLYTTRINPEMSVDEMFKKLDSPFIQGNGVTLDSSSTKSRDEIEAARIRHKKTIKTKPRRDTISPAAALAMQTVDAINSVTQDDEDSKTRADAHPAGYMDTTEYQALSTWFSTPNATIRSVAIVGFASFLIGIGVVIGKLYAKSVTSFVESLFLTDDKRTCMARVPEQYDDCVITAPVDECIPGLHFHFCEVCNVAGACDAVTLRPAGCKCPVAHSISTSEQHKVPIKLQSISTSEIKKTRVLLQTEEEKTDVPKVNTGDFGKAMELDSDKIRSFFSNTSSDPNTISTHRTTVRNCFNISVNGAACKAIGIKDHMCASVGHLFQFGELEYHISIETFQTKNIKYKLQPKDLIRISDSDIVFFNIPTFCPAFKDISHHFIDSFYTTTYKKGYLSTVDFDNTSQLIGLQTITDLNCIRRACDWVPTKSGISKDLQIGRMWTYKAETEVGDCGSPLYVIDPCTPRKILGIHAAYDPKLNKAIGCCIMRQDILKAYEVLRDEPIHIRTAVKQTDYVTVEDPRDQDCPHLMDDFDSAFTDTDFAVNDFLDEIYSGETYRIAMDDPIDTPDQIRTVAVNNMKLIDTYMPWPSHDKWPKGKYVKPNNRFANTGLGCSTLIYKVSAKFAPGVTNLPYGAVPSHDLPEEIVTEILSRNEARAAGDPQLEEELSKFFYNQWYWWTLDKNVIIFVPFFSVVTLSSNLIIDHTYFLVPECRNGLWDYSTPKLLDYNTLTHHIPFYQYPAYLTGSEFDAHFRMRYVDPVRFKPNYYIDPIYCYIRGYFPSYNSSSFKNFMRRAIILSQLARVVKISLSKSCSHYIRKFFMPFMPEYDYMSVVARFFLLATKVVALSFSVYTVYRLFSLVSDPDPFPTIAQVKFNTFEEIGSVDSPPGNSNSNPLVPSVVHGEFPVHSYPAILRPTKIGDETVYPLIKDMAKGDHPKHCLEIEDLPCVSLALADFAREFEKAQIKRQDVVDQYPKRLWDLDESLNGIRKNNVACEWALPIAMTTSPGYPYNVYSKNGKYDFIDRLDNGTLEYRPGIKESILEIEEALLTDEPLEILYQPALKAELRPLEKVKQVKTRVFVICDFKFNLLIRKYFGSFISRLMAVHNDFDVSVGLNVHDREVDYFAERMHLDQEGYHFISGDYSGWDKNLTHQMGMWFADAANDFYQDDYERMRQKIVEHIFTGEYVIGKQIFRIAGMMPSGTAITAVGNSVINSILIRTAFYAHIPSTSYRQLSDDFYEGENVVAVYGDDHVLTINDAWTHVFDMNKFATWLEKIKMPYTSATKDTNFGAFQDRETFTYLKRLFIKTPSGYRAPLPTSVVYDILNWRRKTVDETTAMYANLESFAIECLHYGPEAYKRMINHAASVYAKHGYHFRPEEYSVLKSRISEGANVTGVYTARQKMNFLMMNYAKREQRHVLTNSRRLGNAVWLTWCPEKNKSHCSDSHVCERCQRTALCLVNKTLCLECIGITNVPSYYYHHPLECQHCKDDFIGNYLLTLRGPNRPMVDMYERDFLVNTCIGQTPEYYFPSPADPSVSNIHAYVRKFFLRGSFCSIPRDKLPTFVTKIERLEYFRPELLGVPIKLNFHYPMYLNPPFMPQIVDYILDQIEKAEKCDVILVTPIDVVTRTMPSELYGMNKQTIKNVPTIFESSIYSNNFIDLDLFYFKKPFIRAITEG